jgi:cytochrome c
MRSRLHHLVLPALLCAVSTAGHAQALSLLQAKAGCTACHMADRKLVGPSYKDIAAKYRGRSDALAYLTQRVRKGGPGNWGQVPMVATDVKKLSDADLKAVLDGILKTP